MSNQIVQLTDKDNNNIFPVAGSMAGGSIETGMIQDAAVTLGKIDSSTINTGNLLSQITWYEGVTLNTGNDNYLVKDNLTNRVGIGFSVTRNTTTPAKTRIALGTLPSSLVPSKNIILNCFSYLNTTGGAFIRVYSREIAIWLVDQINAGTEIGVIGSWYV